MKRSAAAVLAELDERLTTQIVEKLDPETRRQIILEEMAPDAAADLLADLSRNTFRRTSGLRCLARKLTEVRELLEFDPRDGRRRMMNPDFAFVGEPDNRAGGSSGLDASKDRS